MTSYDEASAGFVVGFIQTKDQTDWALETMIVKMNQWPFNRHNILRIRMGNGPKYVCGDLMSWFTEKEKCTSISRHILLTQKDALRGSSGPYSTTHAQCSTHYGKAIICYGRRESQKSVILVTGCPVRGAKRTVSRQSRRKLGSYRTCLTYVNSGAMRTAISRCCLGITSLQIRTGKER